MKGIRKNFRVTMVTIYLFLMAALLYVKPNVTFGREGRIRPFGVMQKESTIFPLWYWVFILSAVSYMATIYLAGFRR